MQGERIYELDGEDKEAEAARQQETAEFLKKLQEDIGEELSTDWFRDITASTEAQVTLVSLVSRLFSIYVGEQSLYRSLRELKTEDKMKEIMNKFKELLESNRLEIERLNQENPAEPSESIILRLRRKWGIYSERGESDTSLDEKFEEKLELELKNCLNFLVENPDLYMIMMIEKSELSLRNKIKLALKIIRQQFPISVKFDKDTIGGYGNEKNFATIFQDKNNQVVLKMALGAMFDLAEYIHELAFYLNFKDRHDWRKLKEEGLPESSDFLLLIDYLMWDYFPAELLGISLGTEDVGSLLELG